MCKTLIFQCLNSQNQMQYSAIQVTHSDSVSFRFWFHLDNLDYIKLTADVIKFLCVLFEGILQYKF